MGILTNLLDMAWQQEDARRKEEINRFATIADPKLRGIIQPNIQEWAFDELLKQTPKKAGGIKDIGGMFKGLLFGQKPDQGSQQRFQQALASTGAPPQTVQAPTGVAPGPQQMTGEPGSTESAIGLERTQQPQTSPMTIGGVRPSLLLSPSEQIALKVDEFRTTQRERNRLNEEAEAGMRRIQLDADEEQTRRTEKVRSGMALDAWKKRGQLMQAGFPEDAANEISGWKEHSQIKGAPKLIDASDPQLQAWAARTGNRLEEGAQYYAYVNEKGEVENALKGPPKTPKPAAEFSGTLKEDVEAQNVVSDFEAAQRTGRRTKYTAAEYKAAKDFLAKQNRPPAYIIQQGETRDEARDIADAIMRGDRPPVLTGLGRAGLAGKVSQLLSKAKGPDGKPFNLTRATEDYTAAMASIRAMNSPQQTRLREATSFSVASLDRLSNPQNPGSDLIGQLRRFVPRSQYPILNRAALTAAKNNLFGDAAASAATQIESQVGDLQLELGTVYMGGNSPTDRAIGRAQTMLSGEWSENVLRDAVDLSRANLGYRLNSIQQILPAGISPGSPYTPERAAPVPEAPIVNRGAIAALPKPPQRGAKLDAATARKYLDAFNGDKQAARQQATKDGWQY